MTLLPSTTFVVNTFSMKLSQINKYVIICKIFLEIQAENTVFLHKLAILKGTDC